MKRAFIFAAALAFAAPAMAQPHRDEIITGDDGPDELRGGDNADLIRGAGGNDVLSGADGNDLLLGGDGDDRVYGGDGDDRLYGENDGDLIEGGEGDDVIFGGDGHDWLLGQRGDDYIHGGAGDDRLDGGEGEDTLAGGPGADTFFISSLRARVRILDFRVVEGDRIDLSALDDDGLPPDQPVRFVEGLTPGRGPQAVLETAPSVATLRIDLDGDGASDVEAAIEYGRTPPGAENFTR